MSAARYTMNHRADVERKADGADDGWNHDDDGAFEPHLSALPCRTWLDDDAEIIDGSKTAAIEKRKMIVPLGTDLTERDRVLVVKNRKGEIVFDGPANVTTVGRREDHIVVELDEVS